MDNIELLEAAHDFLDEMSFGGIGKAVAGAGRSMAKSISGGLSSMGSMAKRVGGGAARPAGGGSLGSRAAGAGARAAGGTAGAGGMARRMGQPASAAARPGLNAGEEPVLLRAQQFLNEMTKPKTPRNPIKRLGNKVDTALKAPQKAVRTLGGY